MTAHRARKRFGQNFLHDPNVINHIVASIAPEKDDHIVEIGPGKGALTIALLDYVDSLDAIELDRDLVPILKHNCATHGNDIIHNVDALKFDFQQLVKQGQKLRVIGNLPYNISTPLLFHLISQLACIKDMHFMLQKEVVERMTAAPGDSAYSRLSVMIQYHCQASYLFTVGPEAFSPAPKVHSAIVRLQPHATPPVQVDNIKLFGELVTRAFSFRRKTLRNSIKEMLSSEEIIECGVDPGIRPERLSLESFATLANLLNKKQGK